MSVDSLYCPECGHELTAPLMNLDYSLCKRCNMSVHVDDAERRSSQSILQGSWSRQKVQYLGRAEHPGDAPFTTFSGYIGNLQPDSLVVLCAAYQGCSNVASTTTICGKTPTDTRTKKHNDTYVQISFVKNDGVEGGTFSLDWTGVATKPTRASAHMFALSWMSDSPYVSHKDGAQAVSLAGDLFSTTVLNSTPAGAVAIGIVSVNTNPQGQWELVPSVIDQPFVPVFVQGNVADYIAHAVAVIESTSAGALSFSGEYQGIEGNEQDSACIFEVLN